MNFIEFNNRFPTEEAVVAYYIKTALGGKVICPKCGCAERISVEKGRIKVFHCNNCNSSFSIFKNTIFEKSDTDLRKWLYAINLVTVSKKGISALQLKREIEVTYKTAWRMLKQIRTAMGNVSHDKIFETLVEIDETYVGGKPRKEAKSNKDDDDDTTPPSPNKRGRGTKKTPVVCIKERNSKRVYAQVALPNKEGKALSGKQLFKILDSVCKNETVVLTDDFKGYNILDHKNKNNFVRLTVNHSAGEFSKGNGIHTNGIESFWALLKRGVYGIYHHISVKYMQKYVDEFCFRMNNSDEDCFDNLVKLTAFA